MTQTVKSMKPTLGPAPAAAISTLAVLAVIAAGAWIVAYGLPQGEAAGWWVFIATMGLLLAAIAAFRHIDARRMSLLKKCLVVSVLLHVLIAFCLSAVVVTRQVVRWAAHETPMTPAVNLQLSREMDVRQQIRQQVQELPEVAQPQAQVAQQVDTPLPPAAPRVEAVGAPLADLRQLASSMNPIAPSVPQAPPASALTTPLMPVRPDLKPMNESTPLPSPAVDVARPPAHFPGELDRQLASAASPLAGSGVGQLGAPPASLSQGPPGLGSPTGSGTGRPFSLWDGNAPPPAPEKTPLTVTPPPPAIPQTAAPAQDLLPQRSFDRRQEQLQRAGGTPETEAAVARALVYLSRTQQPDGHWSKITGEPGERTTDAHDCALTGLSVLCYLAAGNTSDRPGPYQDNVRRGVAYLMARESADGDVRGDGNMYDQGIATLALGEAAAMSGGNPGRTIREAAHRAAGFIAAAQNGRGGWRYSPRDLFSDTSVMGWQVLALHSAARTGFEVPPQLRQKTFDYLRSVSTGANGMLTGYLTASPTATMTAEAAFTRMLLGQDLTAAELAETADYLVRKLPARDNLNYYYIYYGSLALMQMQGEQWRQWNGQTSRLLVNLQQLRGPAAGSWDPEASEWGDRGGRIYSTTLATLTLEVYYRYLPMYAQKR